MNKKRILQSVCALLVAAVCWSGLAPWALGEHGGMPAFTREEQAFLDSGRPVVVGFYEDTKPLGYVDRDGTCKGIYAELLDRVREQSGVDLVLQPIDRSLDWQDLVRAGELDFFLSASSSLATGYADFIATDPFFHYDNVLVIRGNCAFHELESPVIALANGRTYLDEYISASLGAGEIRFYRGAKDCLIAVLKGEADGAVLNNVEYNYQSKNARFSELTQWKNYRVTTAGVLMAATDVDPTMFSAVNKALGVLSDDFVDITISDNLNVPYDVTLADNLYIFRYLLAAVSIVGLTAVVAGVVIGRARKRQRDILAQAQERERHQLRILAALSRNYDAIYYVDLDADTCQELWARDLAAEGAGRVVRVSNLYWEMMRQYVERYVQPEYYEVLKPLSEPEAILRRFRESADFTVRYQVKPNDQGQEYFELHMVDVSEEGKEHAMVFGIRCIDEVVRAEADQRQLLQNAMEAANKASAAKSDFLSKMSHDIRTPMNAIIGMTAIAAAHLDDAQRVKDSLDKIDASGRYLLGLINEVLDMSKIESGAIALHEEVLDLEDQKAPESEEREPESAKDRLQDIQGSDYSGYRALLVEDNELNREIAREIMEMTGLVVETAENGQEAVDKVTASERGYYDVIFMDVQMPVMSGCDAAMAIRSLGRSDTLRVPIIAMTANAFAEDVRAARAAGMNEHLSKPLELDKFTAILKKYLG